MEPIFKIEDMNAQKQLAQAMFEKWMEENHPYFFGIVGLIQILTIVSLIVSILLVVIWDVSWWWRLSIISLIAFFVTRWIANLIALKYVEDFKTERLNR